MRKLTIQKDGSLQNTTRGMLIFCPLKACCCDNCAWFNLRIEPAGKGDKKIMVFCKDSPIGEVEPS